MIRSSYLSIKLGRAFVAIAGIAVAFSSNAHAATLFSTGFESPTYVTGNLAGQNGWILDSGTSPFAVVANPLGTGQVVRATGGTATNWVFPDINYTPTAGELVSVNIDIARTVGATSATSSFGYDIDLYSNNTGARFARFGLTVNASNQIVGFVTSRFNTTTSQFDPTGAVTSVIVTNALTANTFYNLRGEFNFTSKLWTLYSGANAVVSNIPFSDLAATGLSDADIQISTATGATDVGYFDNYSVTTVAPVVVPEANTVGLIGIGLAPLAGAVVARRRRKMA